MERTTSIVPRSCRDLGSPVSHIAVFVLKPVVCLLCVQFGSWPSVGTIPRSVKSDSCLSASIYFLLVDWRAGASASVVGNDMWRFIPLPSGYRLGRAGFRKSPFRTSRNSRPTLLRQLRRNTISGRLWSTSNRGATPRRRQPPTRSLR